MISPDIQKRRFLDLPRLFSVVLRQTVTKTVTIAHPEVGLPGRCCRAMDKIPPASLHVRHSKQLCIQGQQIRRARFWCGHNRRTT